MQSHFAKKRDAVEVQSRIADSEQGVTHSDDTRFDDVLEAWRARYRLSPAQVDVLARSARGDHRFAIARARGSSPATVKKQITVLLQRTSDPTLHLAVARFLREIIVRGTWAPARSA